MKFKTFNNFFIVERVKSSLKKEDDEIPLIYDFDEVKTHEVVKVLQVPDDIETWKDAKGCPRAGEYSIVFSHMIESVFVDGLNFDYVTKAAFIASFSKE